MRVIVMFPGALGDLCLLAPAVGALSATGARVVLSVQRCLVPVVTMLQPHVELGPPIDGAAMATLFAGEPDPALRRWLQASDRVHAWLARGDADGALGARFATMGVDARMHAVPRGDAAVHVGEEYAAAFDLSTLPRPVHATPPAATIPPPWHRPGAPRMVLHPGAGARAKCWDRDGFGCVANEWGVAGGEVTVLLGPAEEQEAGFWRGAGHEPVTHLSIVEAAALVATAPVWLGNDSGMSHLAGAIGRRGVVLFGPTRPARWRPLAGDLVPVAFRPNTTAAVTRGVLLRLGIAPPAA